MWDIRYRIPFNTQILWVSQVHQDTLLEDSTHPKPWFTLQALNVILNMELAHRKHHQALADSDKKPHEAMADSDMKHHDAVGDLDMKHHQAMADSDVRHHEAMADSDMLSTPAITQQRLMFQGRPHLPAHVQWGVEKMHVSAQRG